MRIGPRLLALSAISALLLCGCLTTPTATPQLAPAPVMPLPATATSPTAPPTPAPTPTPTLLPARPTATLAPLAPASPTVAVPTPPPAQPDLNLGIVAGNTYALQAATIDPKRGLLYAIGRGDGESGDQQQVSVIDLTTGRPVAAIVIGRGTLMGAQLSLSADGALLYTLTHSAGADGVLTVVRTGGDRGIVHRRSGVLTMALDSRAGRLLIVQGNTLSKLDAAALVEQAATTITALPPAPPLTQSAINQRSRRLYIGQANGAVSVYDAETLRHLADVSLGGRIVQIVAHPDRPETYVLSSSPAALGQHTRVITLLGATAQQTWDATPGFAIARLAIDDVSGDLLLMEDAQDYQVDRALLRRVPVVSGQESTQALTRRYFNLAASVLTYQSTVYDVRSALVQAIASPTRPLERTIPTGIRLSALQLDEPSGRLFALDDAGAVHVIDVNTWAATAAWPLGFTPNAGYAAMRLAAGRLYIADLDDDRTLVLDASTGRRLGVVARAGRVAVDEQRNRLFIVREGVQVADARSLQITGAISETVRSSLMLGPSAFDAFYDSALDAILVYMSNNSPGSSNSSWLQIYHGDTLERLSSPIQSDQRFLHSIVSDAAAGRLYLSSGYPSNTLTGFTLDGRIQAHWQGLGSSLFLDRARQRLYALDWDGIVALDTQTGHIAGYRPLPTVYQRAPSVYDSTRGRFYVIRGDTAWVASIDPDRSPPNVAAAVAAPPAGPVASLAVDAGGDVLAAATEGGRLRLYRFANDGWHSADAGLPEHMRPIILAAPGAPGLLLAYHDGWAPAYGLFRSHDGGRTWRVSNNGLSDLRVQALALSPAFGGDGAGILATADGDVYVTKDGAETWMLLPDVFASHAAMTRVGDEPRFILIAQDPLAYTQTIVFSGSSERIVRSALSAAAGPLRLSGLSAAPDSTTRALALAWQPGAPYLGRADALLLSEDMGQSWRTVASGLGSAFVDADILFSARFAVDGTVYALLLPSFFNADEHSILLRSLDGGRRWDIAVGADAQMSAAAIAGDGRLWTANRRGEVRLLAPTSLTWRSLLAPTPTASPAPTAAPLPTPPLPPAPTATPAAPSAGRFWPDAAFAAQWQQAPVRQALSWASEPAARQVWVAVQAFERGRMIWREDSRQIAVLTADGRWLEYADTWQEGQPEQDPAITPPAGRSQPVRGFGKLWRNEPAVRAALGWASEAERGVTGLVQQFATGFMLRIESTTLALSDRSAPAIWLQP